MIVAAAWLGAPDARAGEVARGELAIVGSGLELDRSPVITAVNVPSYVQTLFGGKAGADAAPAPGLSAVGELTGPGIDTPITVSAVPGQKFAIPALREKGDYALQNVRLVGASGEFLQQSVPSSAIIQVADVLQTRVRVRQLTPDELRERGIHIDDNYEVYEYTFVFGIDAQMVEVPYPVLIDKRTRQMTPLVPGAFALLPPPKLQKPPRFTPPDIVPFALGNGGDDASGDEKAAEPRLTPVTLPAALVVPTGFGVLHQFFAVILQVENNASEASNIRLDAITAKLTTPASLRVSKVVPAVSLGQPVPVVDETTGATFLLAGMQGSAEWTLEALAAGTHTLDLDIRATYQKPGQADFKLGGRVAATIVVDDPRFHVNFSHPDVVRKDAKYTAYSFVTNLSTQRQHVFLDTSDIPPCSSGSVANNVCREEGAARVELDLDPGEMAPVPHKLVSRVTGQVYSAAGAASDDHVGVSIQLRMGVSQSGIPLSPATLVMPYHTQFLPPQFVDANLPLLGLAYSLATAPLSKYTVAKPRVIKTDVFRRAQQIALAGQRVFTMRRSRDVEDPLESSDAFRHLALDLLGNVERRDLAELMPELAEWDDLRRSEEAGRVAGAALARQLERGAATPLQFVNDFAAATSHRTPFFVAYAHGSPVAGNPRPYALKVQGATGLRTMDTPAEAASGWTRGIPHGELSSLQIGGDAGELAIVGRWSETLTISVVPATSSFTLHLLYPDSVSGTTLRSDINVTNATPGQLVAVEVARGARALIVRNATATPIVDVVGQAPLQVLGASQDLFLERGGHVASLLFNRPITIADSVKLRDLLSLTIRVAKAGYTATRRNSPADPAAEMQIPAAVLQDDKRIVLITFDKTLSRNATYEIGVEGIGDLTAAGVSFATAGVVPRVDNDRPAAILTGRVLNGDDTAVAGSLVLMQTTEQRPDRTGFYPLVQYDVAGTDGRYLFEYVPRDLDAGLLGHYTLVAEAAGKQTSVSGAARLPGEVHSVNLVFLGRGSARGQVRWDDGEPIANWEVVAGSTLFGGTFSGRTDAKGNYEITGLPVGPLVLSIVDPDGASVYASTALRTAGEVLTQDLIALRKTGPAPGVAVVRVRVLRSDTMQPVAGAQVAVGSSDLHLLSATTGVDGRFEFRRVPTGLISVIAADFSITRHSAAVEVEIRADQVLEQTLVLQVRPVEDLAFLQGVVTRDDPANPADRSRDQVVGHAIITIPGLPSISAGGDGTYLFPDLPLAKSTAPIRVFDPQTGRRGSFVVPTLLPGANQLPMRLESLKTGIGSIRVRVYGGRGEPVANATVFVPGYPPVYYTNRGSGVYEMGGIHVPQLDEVYATTNDVSGPYGEQYVKGVTRVDFDGQIAVTDLRLPGVGTVVARIEVEQPCSTPPCYAQAIGPVAMTYPVWDEYLQKVGSKTVVGDPDPVTNLVTFRNVPAQRSVVFGTSRHPAGYAEQRVTLGYDGDIRTINLRLSTIGNVTGRVVAHDGITPIAGAGVRIATGRAMYAPGLTRHDGTFEFAAIPANVEFTVVAELQRDGIFRTGMVSATTPQGGGPVSGLTIVMRQQSSIEGRVVDGSSGAAVPLANYWLKELSWPHRSLGTALDPLRADIHGRFIAGNVFTGPFRITAVAPDNQERRGDYQGQLQEEGDVSQRSVEVRIGEGGAGAVSVTVVDPLSSFDRVPNAEVALLRNGIHFDLASTNDAGIAFFEHVPAGAAYSARAFSKSRGRSGQALSFAVAGNKTSPVSVQLDLLGLISGTLTDPDTTPAHQPVRGQPVTYSGAISLRETSSGAGEFEFRGVPEGSFTLQGWESSTQRIADGPPGLFISKLVPEHRNLKLEMERMGTLTVKVHLPNDTGGPGELAPLAEVTASQCTICELLAPDFPYYRTVQGSPTVFGRMFRRVPYTLEVRELGGESRTVSTGGTFPAGVVTHEQTVVLPQSGTVEVVVVDNEGRPVGDAEVRINGRIAWRIFTPVDGKIVLPAVAFGPYSATATRSGASVAAAGELKSRSQPLRLTLRLGSNATVTVSGDVDAEQGVAQPSAGTRVILTASSPSLSAGLRLETRTDSAGQFAFHGVLVASTTLSVIYIGPDDSTIGFRQLGIAIPSGSTGTFQLPPVKIDATPPRVLAITPSSNSTSVSPSSSIAVTFSEPIAAQFLTTQWFELISTDDGARVTHATVQGSVRPDQSYVVTLTPAQPPVGQTFPLKSNVLYRFVIHDSIEDMTGLKLQTTIGTSFTTVDYTEPAVVRIDPPESAPVPEQVTFRIKFNKAVSISSFDPGQGGILTLERLDAYRGSAVETIPIARTLDPVDATTILVAPAGVAIVESAFYRITIANTRDTQVPPNMQRETRVFHLFSFDRVRPVVTIVSPVPAGEKLVSGMLYRAGLSISSDGGAAATDVAYADWLDAGGSSITRVKVAPFAYEFVAPPANGFPYTLKATATDLSGNASAETASFTWEIAPNAAPRDILVTNGVASVYPNGRVDSRVRFADEGLAVSLTLELRGTSLDGTELRQLLGSRNVTRASTSTDFAEVSFVWVVPAGLKDGTARVIATATDSVNNAGSGESGITILLDQTAPVISSFEPAAESRYKFGVNGMVSIIVQTKDLETGVARAVFTVNGVTVLDAAPGSPDPVTGTTTFRKDVAVPPRNADTRVPITVSIRDHRGNIATATRDVIHERVDDSTLPRAAWLTPLDGATLPSSQPGWETTLRVQASDDVNVTSVRFTSAALAAPIQLTAPKSGTTDIYEARVALAMPADGASFVITAIVSDGDPSHDVEIPITIDQVLASAVINGDLHITAATADQYANKSVLVRGNARVYISSPLTLRDLVLIDGAVLSNPEETKLDVSVTGRLFVDADSRIDVSGKGYLGGLRSREDATFTNASRNGRTWGGTATGGADNADGSHGGLGGSFLGVTNASYGSVIEPTDFGSGGAAEPGGAEQGANGGGAVMLSGGRLVVAGAIRADSSSSGSWRAGSGGSLNLRATSLVTSPKTRITANGADESASLDTDSGGGGGRIAIRVAGRYEVGANVLQARGGRNLGGESAGYVDGGAGTIFAQGTLLVSALDERHPTTIHRTAGTPLDGTGSFAAIHIGARALARFDVAVPSNVTADPTAMILGSTDLPALTTGPAVPTAGSSVPQHTAISLGFIAESRCGIREVRTILSAQPMDAVTYPRFVATHSSPGMPVLVPSTTMPGAAALRVRVTDRAGRVVESKPIAFNVVTNDAPAINMLSVLPALETYAGRDISVSASAVDDVAVTSLEISATAGVVTAQAPSAPTAQTMARQFTISIPPETANNTRVAITLSASDGFPGRTPATATHAVTIRPDAIAPVASIVRPAPSEEFAEATGASFVVEVSASDAEVAVRRVIAAVAGVEHELTRGTTNWAASIPVPTVDGTEPVPQTVAVRAFDFQGNVVTREVTILVRPLIDPDAPVLEWACASPGAMFPAGYEATFRVSATPSKPTHGVDRVEITVGGGAPILATRVGTTALYEAKYTVPPGTADGASIDVRVLARSIGGNEATLLSTVTAITGFTISTSSTIGAGDSAFENQSFVIANGGVLTLIGRHQFRNVVVLSGGRLMQKAADGLAADAVNVDRLYVACGGSADVSATGFVHNTTYPGAAASDYGSAGSHIGRGGSNYRSAGGAFGSIYEPKEAGGGGNTPNEAEGSGAGIGGGAIRIHASVAITVDGSVRANGGSARYGTGAGGSIWLSTAGALGGAGTIEAMGGASLSAAGGGAIALEYASNPGTLTVDARGGISGHDSARSGAAGSILRRTNGRTALTVNNQGVQISETSATELPSFGRARVGAVNGATVTVEARTFISPSLAGNRVRAYAPDGSVRGTYRIASVARHATTVIENAATVFTQDGVAYDGYLLYSPGTRAGRKFLAVRKKAAQWQFDDDSAFVNFTPAADEKLFASFSKNSTSFVNLELLRCDALCSVEGLSVLEVAAGQIVADASQWDSPAGPNSFVATPDAGELFLHADASRRAFILTAGSPSVTLQSVTDGPVTVQSGDLLRGVYAFDSVALTSARVVSDDLVEVSTPIQKDAQSSLVSGNLSPPVVDSSKVSVVLGLRGPVVVGGPGAATDADMPLQIMTRNTTSTTDETPLITVDNFTGTGSAGGLSITHLANASLGGGAHTMRRMNGEGHVSFSPSQTNRNIQAGLAPHDTRSDYGEPGHNSFRLRSNAVYEVWADAKDAGRGGAYSTATPFRIEKSATAFRWFVDDVQVYEMSAALPASVVFDVSFEQASSGALHSIRYGTAGLPPASFTASVAADGSFRAPVRGLSGDSVRIRALDGHRDAFTSEEVSIGVIPAGSAVTSLSFSPAEVTGGRTVSATVTLAAPAGAEGALIELSSASTFITLPPSVTIVPGAVSATFNVTSAPVAGTVDATVRATYGGVGPTALLRVTKDLTGPLVTVSSPAPNSAYTEGQATKILVEATVSDADSGVKRVWATLDSVAHEMALTAGVWSAQVAVPPVAGSADVTKSIVVSAEDNTANSSSASAVPIVIKPVVDSAPPAVAWTCLTRGAIFPVGYAVPLRLHATPPNATNSLEAVELLVTRADGVTTTLSAAARPSGEYEATYTVPDLPDGSVITVRGTATTLSGSSASAETTFSVIKGAAEIRVNTAIASVDRTYDGQSVVIWEGVTVTIDGLHAFQRLIILGTLTHPLLSKIDVTSASSYISCTGSIDAAGRGYDDSTRYPGQPGPQHGDGGSHIGRGGLVGETGFTYGSVHHPAEAGTGGLPGNARGGGVVRIDSSTLTVDGNISATGGNVPGTDAGAGSGGSIWITASRVDGAGVIDASGGNGCEAGGGGAVAIDADLLGGPPLRVRATAGQWLGTACSNRFGGPGTVRIVGPSSTYGTLTIDGGGRGAGTTELPALGYGWARSGSGGATLVTDRPADVPLYFSGHWLVVRSASTGTVKGVWRVGGIAGKIITLLPNSAETIDVAVGDEWEGLYRFDLLRLRTVTLLSADPIAYGVLDSDPTSAIVFNMGAPRLDPARVAIESFVELDVVAGAAGSAMDADVPIRIAAKNIRTGQTFAGNALADGSFRIPVQGLTGDTFSITATDSHVLPRTSRSAVAGAITDPNSVASLAVSSVAVTAGTRTFGTIRLVYPARAGGVTVAIASSNSARAGVPSAVTLPGGASTIQFPIDTLPSSPTETVTITASLRTTRSAVLTVTSLENALASLTLSAPAAEGGTTVNGTVTIGAAAPAAGAFILLSTSDNTHASVPPHILIPAGATSGTFAITTYRSAVPVQVTIGATWGVAKTAPLSLSSCNAIGSVPPSAGRPTTIWFDDTLPSGATATGAASFDASQAASGTSALHFPSSGIARTWSFSGGAPLAVRPEDRLEFLVLANPCDPPRQIAVTWSGALSLRATWGEGLIEPGTQMRAGPIATEGAWVRYSVLARSLGLAAPTSITGLSVSVFGGEAWFDVAGATACALDLRARPERNANEIVWLDDDAPAGATLASLEDARYVPWQWTTSQVASGTRAHLVPARTGAHQTLLSAGPARFAVGNGDLIFAYVLVDPCNPPRQLMLEFHDGTSWTRASWGEDLVPWGDQQRNVGMGPIPAPGSWVRLEIPASLLALDLNDIQQMAFTLYDGAAWFDAVGTIPRVNLALGKPATQASELDAAGTYPARLVVDGDMVTGNHTSNGPEAWWQVDLGAIEAIDTISIWNLPNCCQTRLSNFWVFVSDTPFASGTIAGTRAQPGVRAFRHAPVGGLPTTIRVNRPGRFVRVQLESDYLHMMEVQVWAPATAGRINYAAGSSGASQASLFQTAGAERAVDGRTDGEYDLFQSTSHTGSTTQSWWEIDLGAVQPLSRIDLFAQVPVADRLQHFYVFVSDVPFASRAVAETLAQPGVFAHYYGSPMRAGYAFETTRTGRYIRVQLSGTNYLVLGEVQVWSLPSLLKSLVRAPAGADR